ncbi:MAG TPA: hypothetical protein PLQ44_01520 [Candidatus Paceibacterota bacterium]|nr:hypothetical protein [Candidatus Paceibacterota bacterium]HPT40266.1 hypothetical protein [Candidatus Paceibacterota bacterium]
MTKTKGQNKSDLLILDKCSTLSPEQIKNLKVLSNTKIVRTTDNIIGLTQTTQDSQIVQRAIEIYNSGEYRTVNILTEDRGGDNDKTFQTAYRNICIISVKNENINIINRIKDFCSVSGFLTKIDPDKITKTKYKDQNRRHITKIK